MQSPHNYVHGTNLNSFDHNITDTLELNEDIFEFLKSHLKDVIIESKKRNSSNLPSSSNLLQTYNQIKGFATQNEFELERDKLKKLIDSSHNLAELKEKFLNLCRERDLNNANTIFSFSADPLSATNKLYWTFALRIFQPENLQEMFQILFPHITQTVNINVKIKKNTKNILNEKYDLELKSGDLSELTNYKITEYPANSVRKIVFDKDKIFILDQIENQSFSNHQKIHSLLEIYPSLHNKIYTHNPKLMELKEDIKWMRNEGETPMEAIKRLIFDFKRYGQTLTGDSFSRIEAVLNFEKFNEYYDRLPEELRNKLDDLIAPPIGSEQAMTFKKIIQHVKRGSCIEVFGYRPLERLINHAPNLPILNTKIDTAAEKYHKIHKKYGNIHIWMNLKTNNTDTRQTGDNKSAELVSLEGYDHTSKIPEKFLKNALFKIKFDDFGNFIELMINLPSDQYRYLFSCKINPVFLPLMVKQKDLLLDTLGKLSPKQQKVFFSLLTNENNICVLFGYQNIAAAIDFIREKAPIYNGGFIHELIDDILTSLINNKEKFINKLTHPEFVSALLKCFSTSYKVIYSTLHKLDEEQRQIALAFLNHDKQDITILHAASQLNYAEFSNFLQLYPDGKQKRALATLNSKDQSVLTFAALNNFDLFIELIKKHHEINIADLVVKNPSGQNNLLEILCDEKPDHLVKLISQLYENEKEFLLTHQDKYGNTFFHKNNEILLKLIPFISPELLAKIATLPNNNSFIPLYNLFKNDNTNCYAIKILNTLSTTEQKQIISKKIDGKPLLFYIKDAESFIKIKKLFLAAELTELYKKNISSFIGYIRNFIMMKSKNSSSSLIEIIKDIPQESLYDFLTNKYYVNNSFSTMLITEIFQNDFSTFLYIFSIMPKEKICNAIFNDKTKFDNKSMNNWLYAVSQLPKKHRSKFILQDNLNYFNFNPILFEIALTLLPKNERTQFISCNIKYFHFYFLNQSKNNLRANYFDKEQQLDRDLQLLRSFEDILSKIDSHDLWKLLIAEHSFSTEHSILRRILLHPNLEIFVKLLCHHLSKKNFLKLITYSIHDNKSILLVLTKRGKFDDILQILEGLPANDKISLISQWFSLNKFKLDANGFNIHLSKKLDFIITLLKYLPMEKRLSIIKHFPIVDYFIECSHINFNRVFALMDLFPKQFTNYSRLDQASKGPFIFNQGNMIFTSKPFLVTNRDAKTFLSIFNFLSEYDKKCLFKFISPKFSPLILKISSRQEEIKEILCLKNSSNESLLYYMIISGNFSFTEIRDYLNYFSESELLSIFKEMFLTQPGDFNEMKNIFSYFPLFPVEIRFTLINIIYQNIHILNHSFETKLYKTFATIYQELYNQDTSYVKSNHLKTINADSFSPKKTMSIIQYAKEHPQSRVAKAWELTITHFDDVSNNNKLADEICLFSINNNSLSKKIGFFSSSKITNMDDSRIDKIAFRQQRDRVVASLR